MSFFLSFLPPFFSCCLECVTSVFGDEGCAKRFLGFCSWWINPLFAHRAGIIDRDLATTGHGGILSDSRGAYAILLVDDDEVPDDAASTHPHQFVYRARSRDPGRYRLTSATLESRYPVRVLRSHTLKSFLRPRAGVRYEGL